MNALTIDLEDWHQLAYRQATGRETAPSPRVVRDTHRVLDLLDEAGTRATFFVLGMVAEAHPDLVREVRRRGHEIGSHSHAHRLVHALSPGELRDDLKRSKAFLEDLTGDRVVGFRAPEFSVKRLDSPCFAVLREVGFEYDSSVFPLPGSRYGIPDAPTHPFSIDTPAGAIREFPLATWRTLGRTVPVAGGTYYRVLPLAVLRHALHERNTPGQVNVLYFHPYEFTRGLLLLSGLTLRERMSLAHIRFSILHNLATPLIAHRLRALLGAFDFVRLADLCHGPGAGTYLYQEETVSHD